RIGHEEDHQRHHGGVEPIIGERKCHRIAFLKYCPSCTRPLAREGELRTGWIDAVHLARRKALDQQLGERAAAASDIDPAQTGWRCHPIEEDVAGEETPSAHPFLVGSPILETNFRLCHVSYCSFCRR